MSTIAENILKTLKSWLASSDVPTTVTPTQLVMKSDDTGKEYLVHPETEAAMVVDFVQAVIQQLKDMPVTTDANGKFTCEALGVSGVLAQNGYISLGPKFGGLIIQWVSISSDTSPILLTYPIAMKNLYAIAGTDFVTENNGLVFGCTNVRNTSVTIFGRRVNQINSEQVFGRFVLLGKN